MPATAADIISLLDQGKSDEAKRQATALLESRPQDAEAWHIKGIIAQRQGDNAAALASFNQALQYRPNFSQACFDMASLLDKSGPAMLAAKTYQHLLSMDPNHPTAKQRLEALKRQLDQVDDWFQKGGQLYHAGRLEEAVAAYLQALVIHPRVPEVLANMALALYHLRRYTEAEAAVMEALRLKPRYVEALNTLGNLQQEDRRYEQAIATYKKGIAVDPRYVNIRINLGKLLRKTKDDAGATAVYEEALKLAPNHPELLAELLYRRHNLCRWDGVAELQVRLERALSDGTSCASPFLVILNAPAKLQRGNAERWSLQQYGAGLAYDANRPLPSPEGDKLRIGYLSADYCQHATAVLISQLFEQHDRKQFDVIAYSTGADDKSPERARIIKAVDNFRDLASLDSANAAQQIWRDKIDILIDLKGYTQDHRLDIMAQRPAPLQMHYLGYPGTTGAKFIDYFIADAIAAPAGADELFSEKLIRLPHSYQINDRARPLPTAFKSRAEYGLPEKGFVFCGFNQVYKITPEMFDIWMQLLKTVDGSVLWLYERSDESTANLKREAQARGVGPSRLVMAPHANLSEHLARYRLADVFLDTAPVCGHTTASDALWAGVPVVTLSGDSFASRVAASLLHAVGLPELVTTNMEDYEALALALAQDTARLARLKAHLEQGRMQFPLFDSAATTRAIEAAYRHAAALHRAGEAPAAFIVNDDGKIA